MDTNDSVVFIVSARGCRPFLKGVFRLTKIRKYKIFAVFLSAKKRDVNSRSCFSESLLLVRLPVLTFLAFGVEMLYLCNSEAGSLWKIARFYVVFR